MINVHGLRVLCVLAFFVSTDNHSSCKRIELTTIQDISNVIPSNNAGMLSVRTDQSNAETDPVLAAEDVKG